MPRLLAFFLILLAAPVHAADAKPADDVRPLLHLLPEVPQRGQGRGRRQLRAAAGERRRRPGQPRLWKRAGRRLAANEMPPEGAKQPTAGREETPGRMDGRRGGLPRLRPGPARPGAEPAPPADARGVREHAARPVRPALRRRRRGRPAGRPDHRRPLRHAGRQPDRLARRDGEVFHRRRPHRRGGLRRPPRRGSPQARSSPGPTSKPTEAAGRPADRHAPGPPGLPPPARGPTT